MTEHLDHLIDHRNSDLWESIKEEFEIELLESPEPNYMSRVVDKKATICIYKNDLNPAHFTHELLHIYLKSKDVQIVEDFNRAIESEEKLNYLFSHALKEHVTNCLEHYLMLPIFLRLGYENELFISDYNEIKIEKAQLSALQERYRANGIYEREAVDFFIGKYFAMKTCNNESFKYYNYLKAFQKIDKRLFKLLNDFWKDWKTFDFEDPEDKYDEILELFIDDLNGWIDKKTLV